MYKCIKKTLIFHRLIIKFIIHHLELIVIFSSTLKFVIGRFFEDVTYIKFNAQFILYLKK